MSKPLLDSFGRFHNYLRMSVTERCNLRCTYCMPKDGITLTPEDKILSLEDQKRTIGLFASLGVNKLRFSGGEPTVYKGLTELIGYSRSIPTIKSIGITTNGIKLGGIASNMETLRDAGLTHANISLDTLQPEKFERISRRDKRGLVRVFQAIEKGIKFGVRIKINCVLMRGTNDMEIAQFVELAKTLPIDIRFIEVMPFDDNKWSSKTMVSYFEAIDMLKQQGISLIKDKPDLTSPLSVGTDRIFDPNDTTKWYRVGEVGADGTKSLDSDFQGRIGFISSMTSHFCGGCNRLRITADGKLKVCLFGDEGLSLLDCFRAGMSDTEIIEHIGKSVGDKKKSLGGFNSPEELALQQNRPMILIGG